MNTIPDFASINRRNPIAIYNRHFPPKEVLVYIETYEVFYAIRIE